MQLDILLRLVPYSPLERELIGQPVLHPVRTLAELELVTGLDGSQQFRIHDPVRAALDSWYRESRDDFNKIVTRLRTAACNEEIGNVNILRPAQHPSAKGIHEIVGKRDHARVFIFYDPPSGRIIVGAETYWKRGNSPAKERRKQDEAILRAANRRKTWLDADPIPNLPDCRVLRQRK